MVALSLEKPILPNDPEVIEKIQGTEELLFHLADQLLATDKDRWNVIVGDDMGGRLPTHFVHTILKDDNRELETFFVANTGAYRRAKGTEPYEQYFKYVSDQVGAPLRPLIVTESVGSGDSVNFIKNLLAPYCEQAPEVASVAVAEKSMDKVDYAGGVGDEALQQVWQAYESPHPESFSKRALHKVWHVVPEKTRENLRSKTALRITKSSINEAVGIMSDMESDRPVAAVSRRRNAQLSRRAFVLMDEMASDYSAHVDA